MGLDDKRLTAFVRESNAIEDITRAPTTEELAIHRAFLQNPAPDVPALIAFVDVIQPGAVLRDRLGLDVVVGTHRPPAGGPEIRLQLTGLLVAAAIAISDPYTTHHAYETLHPFLDGNGRSGRALWLWQMTRQHGYRGELGFLHAWYYQSLQAARGPA